MIIDILTIFPKMFTSPFAESIVKRAQDQKLISIQIHDLRHWTHDKRHTVDDRPYGGGPGMVMLIEPIYRALKDLHLSSSPNSSRTILTSASGKLFTQTKAVALAKFDHLVFIAGHYEGVDQRVADHLVDEELSIGNYVLTGGELPVMVMVDAITRLIPGVLGDPDSLTDESHTRPGYLEYPHYSRPEKYKAWTVPDVLLSGDHAKIKAWRTKKAQKNSP